MISTKFNAQMAESVVGRRMQIEAGSSLITGGCTEKCDLTLGRCLPQQIDGTNAAASDAAH
ncbi:hypothetical protein [Brucella sp. IR073]|uniref:hypothetical protein n=1 Tax=unclassified Brucella TaxID=2632610 RepID=UPI003B983D49